MVRLSATRTQNGMLHGIVRSGIAVTAICLLLAGCGSEEDAASDTETQIIHSFDAEALNRSRSEKDRFLRESTDSPIPSEERAAFTGLRYYPPDSTSAVAASFKAFENPEQVSMMMTGGDPVAMLRAGEFSFDIDGEAVRLIAYENSADPGRLFIPFRDATNGVTTYWGGRYLEVRRRSGSEYVLDFNHAYNPYCAYNHAYSCPVVPLENILAVEIRAGEQFEGEDIDISK